MTTIINFKTDKKVKSEAQAIAKKMGINLSDVLNILLRSFVRDKELNINLEEPSEFFIKSMAQAQADLAKGDVSPGFDNAEDAIKWLNDKKRKYAN